MAISYSFKNLIFFCFDHESKQVLHVAAGKMVSSVDPDQCQAATLPCYL